LGRLSLRIAVLVSNNGTGTATLYTVNPATDATTKVAAQTTL
jgi:hypothetical protein